MDSIRSHPLYLRPSVSTGHSQLVFVLLPCPSAYNQSLLFIYVSVYTYAYSHTFCAGDLLGVFASFLAPIEVDLVAGDGGGMFSLSTSI